MKRKSTIKKLVIAVLLLTNSFFEGDLKAQCGSGTSVALTTQTDVNNFITNYCADFLGVLIILDNNDGLDNITDLNPLSPLTAVGGFLLIRNNQSLSSLNGLQSLSTVNEGNGGNGLLLLSNTALTDISSLSNLTTVGGNLTIQGNNMASLVGLENLSSIGGNLSITDNDLLTDLTSLSNLTSIDGALTINLNDLLTSLSGLENIDPATIVSANPSIDDIIILDNPLLNECEVTSICQAFDINTLTTDIMNNASNCAGNLAIITACQSLPVEWLNPVVAITKENKIEIRFATSVQVNNSHFEIEHSQDGRNYYPIGIIEGDGSSSLESYYKYFDEDPSIGKNYYRVKQVDFDGKYEYSNIAAARFKANEIIIFPNPANEELTIISKEKQALVVYNQLGKIVKRIAINEERNTIDISEFESGFYYLSIGNKLEILIKE